jgi:hypothetical protein
MQDEALAHFTCDLRQLFGLSLPRSMSMTKQTHFVALLLPDLIHAKLCLWGHLKGTVYSKRVNMQDEL